MSDINDVPELATEHSIRAIAIELIDELHKPTVSSNWAADCAHTLQRFKLRHALQEYLKNQIDLRENN